ncbi:hypothetical protein C8R42DRAFT_686948 [Lentinula raphanica]|nr:hypothetical protein C8R42DRAFT_686948 [Lentinula raphanica]
MARHERCKNRGERSMSPAVYTWRRIPHCNFRISSNLGRVRGEREDEKGRKCLAGNERQLRKR